MNWVILGVISTKVAFELAILLASLVALSLAAVALLASARAGFRTTDSVRRRILLVPVHTVVPARATARRLSNGPSRASPDLTFDQRCIATGFGRPNGYSRRR